MKKIFFLFGGIVCLMLFSFNNDQEKKVVRLKNGNYQVYQLKMKEKDIEALYQAAGWERIAVIGVEDPRMVLDEKAVEDVITTKVWRWYLDEGGDDDDADDKDGSDKEDPQEEIDKIMRAYL